MSSEPSHAYTIEMGFTAQDKLNECDAYLRYQYARIVDQGYKENGKPFESTDEVRDELYKLAREYASFVSCLVQIMTTTPYDGPLIHVSAEGKLGFFFYRPGSGYNGSMMYHDGAWSIHT